jgi:protocatechuate 3,4-dioxygenase beta subunit
MGAGLMRRVLTTVFFPGFDTGADPVMALVPAALRPLLVAEPARRDKGLRALRFDIRLRGEGETPFFDL